MALALAVRDFQPMLARLREEEVHRGLVLWRNGLVLPEEAPAIEIERVSRAGNVILRMSPLQDPLVVLVHPTVEARERFHGGRCVDVHAEMTQPAKARGDV